MLGRIRRNFLPRKLIALSLVLIFGASFFVVKLLTNSASAELAEIDPADWRLETFFLDAEVNEGRDPIQNLIWEPEVQEYDASQPGQAYQHSRIVTLQINYHNENVARDYLSGELELRVPTPFPADKLNYASVIVSEKKIGANTGEVVDYEWDYLDDAQDADTYLTFVNSSTMNAGENVEGSIQITFKLTSSLFEHIDSFEDKQSRTFTTPITASLNGTATSNEATFTFNRTINYHWRKARWRVSLTPSKITTYTGLGENPENYTWVKWRYATDYNGYMNISERFHNNYYGVSDYSFIEELFADDVRILPLRKDLFNTEIINNGDGQYSLRNNTDTGYFVTGYPKDTYNSDLGTNMVTEKVVLSGTYLGSDISETISTATKTVNLDDYQFDPNAGYIGVGKTLGVTLNTNGGRIFAQEFRDTAPDIWYTISGSFYDFSGEPYDLLIGDDVVFYEDTTTGEVARLSEDYYQFGMIERIYVYDFDEEYVDCDEYETAIYARTRGSTEYSKVNQRIRCNNYYGYVALPSNTVAWYLEIKGMNKPIRRVSIDGRHPIVFRTAPDEGKIYDFARLQIRKNGQLLNPKTIDDYPDNPAKNLVARYDEETYGELQHRASGSVSWTSQKMPSVIYRTYNSGVRGKTPEYSPVDDAFHGQVSLSSSAVDYNNREIDTIGKWHYIADQFDEKNLHTKLRSYMLMPKGAMLESTEEEIINSATGSSDSAYAGYKNKDGERIFSSMSEFHQFLRSHTTVEVINNWRNSGQTYIQVETDFSEKPFTTFNCSSDQWSISYGSIKYEIKYRISYDSFREEGLNYLFMAATDDDLAHLGIDGLQGTFSSKAKDADDFNDDGRTDDYIWRSSGAITLLPVASTHQNIQTSIFSKEKGEYNLDDTIIEPGEEYSYKLRLRNATNRITNAVVYSNLEEAYEDNPHWNGEFVGVDTTFAESQLDNNGNPVKIKVYWSPKSAAGKLASDDSWQEYDEATVDKSQVKSLAFKYLDQNGDPAILPQSNYSYVLVNMKAPDDDSISTYAYNKSFSEWNPIDNLNGEIQPLLTGIESNVVRAYFSDEIEAHAKKIWNDQDNKYNLRPRAITFHLYDGDDLIDEGEIDIENLEDSFDFANLSIANRANYRIEIDPIEGYNTTLDIDFDTLTFTFTSSIILPDEPKNDDTPTPEAIPETPATHDSVAIYAISVSALLATAYIIKRRSARR